MKRWFTTLAATLFFIAATGLVIIQIWQIQRSVAISDSLFNTSVTNAMDEVIVAMENDKPDLVTDIDFPQLDSTIDQALLSTGLDVKPALGVCPTDFSEYYYLSEPGLERKMEDSPYKYSFSLPDDPVEYYLILHFSDRALFLLKNSNIFIYMSILLIVIISISYVITARTLQNQRKVEAMRQNFINNMTHELKTPITTIRLESSFLQECRDLDSEQQQQHLQVIHSENERMLQLVESVLRNSRMARKKFTLRYSEVDVNQLVEKEMRRAEVRVEKAGGSQSLELGSGLPAVVADVEHLTNAVSNLIDNAIKYSPEHPTITARTRVDGKWVCISISDKGLGISKEDLKHITETFYRVGTGDRHDVKGFGIGLSYVQQVVKAHHGKLEIGSKLGEGSTFTIKLPVAAINNK